MRARRVAALWIPGLALQCAARDDAALRVHPVAITDGKIVLARNRRAVEAGIAVGMRVAEVATRAPDVLLVPDDPQAVQTVWDAVLLHLDQLGPTVEDAGLGEALVDLSGVGSGERLQVRRTLTALTALLHLTARAAVAEGPFVALLAAHRAAQMGTVAVIPPGRGGAFLAGQSVAALPLPASMQGEVALLGIRTIGAFAGLRPSDVQRRFGQIGMAALALALGRDDRPLVPRPRVRSETLAHPFQPPVEDVTPVLFVVKALLDSHAATLRREGLVAQGLRLTLTFEGGAPLVIEQRWGAATIPGHAELDTVRLALDARVSETAGGAMPPRIEGVCVALLDCAPNAGVQLPLMGGAMVLRRQAVAQFLTRVRALIGSEGVVEAVPVAAHLPERGWEARPYEAARIGTPAPEGAAEGSAVLAPTTGFATCVPPEPLTLGWHNDMPAVLRLGETQSDIIAALGPYTADGEWWGAGGYARAYWVALTADQTLHLIAEDRVSGRWARYGVFN